jgi:hypothetical protein
MVGSPVEDCILLFSKILSVKKKGDGEVFD